MTSNVAATSTTGLYGISGNTRVPNSAQQLLNLLYSNGNVDFSLTGAGTQVQANALVGGGAVSGSVVLTGDVTASGNTGTPIATALSTTGVVAGTYGSDTTIPTIVVDAKGRVTSITTNAVSGGGSYGNANVAAYLPTYTGSLANSSTIVAIDANLGTATTNITTLQGNAGSQQTQIDSLQSNAGVQATQIITLNANLGAFETYANATFSTGGGGSYGNANVAAYLPTYTGSLANSSTIVAIDANLGTATTNITTLQANAGAQATAINALNANVGAFETYANVTFSTIANAASQQTQIDTNTTGLATLNANVGAFETYANLTFGTSNYGNANVAAYLPTYTGSLANSSTIQTIDANLGTATTNITTLFANAATQSTAITGIVDGTTTLANVKSTGGYFWANGTAYSTGSGSTYGNTDVAAYLDGSAGTIREGNVTLGGLFLIGGTNTPGTGALLTLSPATVSGGGGPGPVAYFNTTNVVVSSGYVGSAEGPRIDSVLYDAVKGRLFANAYPLSKPDSSISNNVYSGYMVTAPTYTNGQVQQPPLANATTGGTTIVGTSSQVVGLVQSSNIGLQSGYGYGAQNRNTVGALVDLTVTPVTANAMSNQDRVRAFTAAVDYQTRGINTGLMTTTSQNASTVTGLAGLTYINGSGNVGGAVGALTGVLITPAAGLTSNIQYATGTMPFINLLSTAGTTGKANIVYARGIAPFVTSFSANLTVQNAVGLHTYSGWAGTNIGTGSTTGAYAAYAVLNQDAGTVIQTNGNLTVTGNTSLGAYKETVFAYGNTGGEINIAVGTAGASVYTMTLTANLIINTNNLSSMPTGGTITLIITQDGTGGKTLTSNLKYAGGSKTLSTAAGAIDTINVFYDGTNYLAALVKGYA